MDGGEIHRGFCCSIAVRQALSEFLRRLRQIPRGSVDTAYQPQPPTIITIVNGGTNKMRIGLLRNEILSICCGLLLIAGAVEVCAQSVPDSADKVQPLLVGAQIP